MSGEVELSEVSPEINDGKPVEEPNPDFSDKFQMAMIFDAGTKNGGLLGTKLTPEQADKYAARKIYRMQQCGLHTFAYRSEMKTEIICLIGTVDQGTSTADMALNIMIGKESAKNARSVLHTFADAINFPVKLDEKKAEAVMKAGASGIFTGRVYPPLNDEVTPMRPFEHIYGHYEWEQHDELFAKSPPDDLSEGAEFNDDPFTRVIRIKLIYELLRAKAKEGGCGFHLSKMLHDGKIKAVFPLHNQIESDKVWQSYGFANSDEKFDNIKEYFGEKVAMYFNFVCHIRSYLFQIALLGLALTIFTAAAGAPSDHWLLLLWSAVILTWSIVMLEQWKRKQMENAVRWGMTDFDVTETDRPEFAPDEMLPDFIHGESVDDPDERSMKFVHPKSQRNRFAYSFLVVGTMVLIVVGVLSGIYILRYNSFFAPGHIPGASSSSLASACNAVQIQVFGFIFSEIAKIMTTLENQRTDTLYENSLISKLFVFQFVNSYSSFFYLAFIAENFVDKPSWTDDDGDEKDWVGDCGAETCMEPLQLNLVIIFCVRLIVTNATNFLIPWYTTRTNKKAALNKCGHLLFSPAEEQFLLTPYDPIHDSINRYSDFAIQYGFMVLFATALPASTALALLECLVGSRVDLYLMLNFKQRAIPRGADDIGGWLEVFQTLSSFAIVTNAGICCFTMQVLKNGRVFKHQLEFSDRTIMWIFIGIQWFFFSVQSIIEKIIPDVTFSTNVQLERLKFIVAKALEKQKDEDPEADTDDSSDDEDAPGKMKSKSAKSIENVDDVLAEVKDVRKSLKKALGTKKKKKKRKGWAPPISEVMSEYPSLSEQDLTTRFHACKHPTLTKKSKAEDLGSEIMDSLGGFGEAVYETVTCSGPTTADVDPVVEKV